MSSDKLMIEKGRYFGQCIPPKRDGALSAQKIDTFCSIQIFMILRVELNEKINSNQWNQNWVVDRSLAKLAATISKDINFTTALIK